MSLQGVVRRARHVEGKRATALLLTFAAGFVDIVGYLSFYHQFTAHMTGDTVHLGNDLLQRHWTDAVAAGCIIGAFLAGSIAGRAIIEIGRRAQVRRIASVTLLIEAGLIVAVIPLLGPPAGEVPAPVFLALLAAAMGVQTATLTRIGSLTVHTTFVTGMLNKFAQLISQALFLSFDVHSGHPVHSDRDRMVCDARFIGSIWLLYLAGAVAGTAVQEARGSAALLVPVVLIIGAVVVDQVSPLSIEEEQDQG